MSNEDSVRVRTFYNQEHARISISELCARCVQDVLYLLDSATGPDGVDDTGEPLDPEASKLYWEFREWFGPNVAATIQSMVVGPLLSRISVDSDGSVHIEDEVYKKYDSSDAEGMSRHISRMKWIASEIPLLIESYGQLYEQESSVALAMCDDVFAFDYSSESAYQFVDECLPALEVFYLHAQDGGRLLRGDMEAEDAFRASLEWSRDRVKELESSRKKALTSSSPSESQRVEIQYEITKLESRRKRMENSISEIENTINDLVERLYD